ncbi:MULTISPECIES: hypothetical protein [Cytobacillus]|uniref:hypothetical protein n=1 Tax=Cytobacillus TaxID=2675230 RepID=UPI000DEA8C6F|nr:MULTISPECIES: hypothetical protein [Cytobacillus]
MLTISPVTGIRISLYVFLGTFAIERIFSVGGRMMKRVENGFNSIELLQLRIYDTDRRLKQ